MSATKNEPSAGGPLGVLISLLEETDGVLERMDEAGGPTAILPFWGMLLERLTIMLPTVREAMPTPVIVAVCDALLAQVTAASALPDIQALRAEVADARTTLRAAEQLDRLASLMNARRQP